MIKDRITEYFEAHKDEALSRLCALCAIPSVQGAPEVGKPFGPAVDDALRLAEKMFADEGFATERDPEGRYVLSYCGEGERSIGLFAHADVVPPGEGWTLTEPFAPRAVEDILVARGVHDNKAGIVSSLYLFKAIRDLGIPVRSRLVCFIGGNEETGMEDIKAYRAAHTAPDVSIVPDNSYPFSLGEKGRVTAWLVSPPLLSDVIDFSGGNAYNVVLDHATATMYYSPALYDALDAAVKGRPDLTLTANAAGDRIILTAKGRPAHAAAPGGGINAASLIAEVLAACPALSADERGVMASAAMFLADPYGGALGMAGSDGVFGRRTAAAGMVRVRDGHLFISQDIRFGTGITADELLSVIAEGADAEDFEVMVDTKADAFDLGDDAPFAAPLLDAFVRITENADVRPYRSGGGTYAKHLPNAYSVGVLYRPEGERHALIPEKHGGAHAPDEFIRVGAFLDSLRVLMEYITTADGVLQNA